MNNLYILCGIPGCGKSTWVKNRMAENTSTDPKWECVSRDEVRFSIIKEEDDYFSKEKQVFNEFVKRICEKLDDAWVANVIADATHLNEVSRNKLINAIRRSRHKDKPLHITMVYFDIPLEVCKFRNNKRIGRMRVPDDVMDKMYRSLEFPQLREGLERIEIVRD